MSDEYQTFKMVLTDVSEQVNEMYQRYRNKMGLQDEKDTLKQLEILTQKKYISKTFISDLSLITDYYERGYLGLYLSELERYKYRIMNILEII